MLGADADLLVGSDVNLLVGAHRGSLVGADIELPVGTYMGLLINCKFSQNPHLAEKLCATGTLQLGEAISYDNYWGTGLSIVSKNTTIQKHWGQNKLGKLLMKLRGTLKV